MKEESEQEPLLDDAKEMLPGKAYHWRDWCICRGRDCLYIWSDAAALELSNGSNGWFRFILDGKLATMYSSGSPEGGTDSSGECLNKSQFYSIVTWNYQGGDELTFCDYLACLCINFHTYFISKMLVIVVLL